MGASSQFVVSHLRQSVQQTAPVHVLHLLASTDRRGAEVFARELHEELVRRGHHGDLVALSGAGAPGVEVLDALRSPAAARALRQRARRADVVLGHGSRGLVGGTLATLGSRTPLVYRSIGDPRYWGASWARRVRVGLQLRRAAQVTALWPDAGRAIVDQYGVAPERVTVIPNGADDRRFCPADEQRRQDARRALGLAEDAPVALAIGALSPEKRVPELIAAVAATPDVVVVVAGDGPQRPEVERALAALPPGRGHLLGTVTDVAAMYDAADVVVLASATEGQPGVAIEAGLCGLPVVATDVGGVSSVVIDGTTGLLVPFDAAADVLARAVVEAIARREPLGRAARERTAASLTVAVVAAQFESVLATAAAGRRR